MDQKVNREKAEIWDLEGLMVIEVKLVSVGKRAIVDSGGYGSQRIRWS